MDAPVGQDETPEQLRRGHQCPTDDRYSLSAVRQPQQAVHSSKQQ